MTSTTQHLLEQCNLDREGSINLLMQLTYSDNAGYTNAIQKEKTNQTADPFD